MSGSLDVDALVIGAGPAGSASAAHLAAAGWRVLLVDRAAFPRDKPCSEYMSPETVRLLDDLGVVAALRQAGAVPLRGSSVTAAGGSRLLGHFPSGIGLSISRHELDHVLVREATRRGARLMEGIAFTHLVRDGGRVSGAAFQGRAKAPFTVRAAVTIGADGLRSRVARALGGQRRGWPGRVAFVAHLRDVPGLSTHAEMHVGRTGYVGLNPIGGGIANVALVVPHAVASGAAGRAEAFFFEQLRHVAAVRDRVAPENLVREVLVTGPFAASAKRVTAPGALLVGDAADFFDPFTGEGICAALSGAALASHCLGSAGASGRSIDRGISRYRSERRRQLLGKWAVERLIGYAMMAPALFDHAVQRIGHRPGMADTLVGVTGRVLPARDVLNPLFLARMVL